MWINWVGQVITAAGDTVTLHYRDNRFPTYELEYDFLILNEETFTEDWQIDEVLDKLVTDTELAKLMMNAQRRAA